MQRMTLLKPVAWDTPAGMGTLTVTACKDLGALTTTPPNSLPAGEALSSLSSPSSMGSCPVPPRTGFSAGSSSVDQMPTEGITHRHLWRGCSAHGAHPKPVAFHPSLLPCFSRFLLHVCVSQEGKWEGNLCWGPRASLCSLLAVSPLWCPQRGDAR